MNLGAPPTIDAPRARALYVAACAGLLCFSAGFILTATVSGLTVPWYEPLEHRWILAPVAPTPVAMDYFARVGIASLLGIGGATAGFFAGKRPLSATALRAVFVWALGMTLLGLFLYAWALGTRVIVRS